MLDLLPLDVWNSSTKFLDPACKGGEYLKEVYDRLMKSNALKAEFPNIIERSNHILKNQIYGIALSRTSLDRTTKKLLGEDRNIKLIPDYIKLIKLLKPPKKGKADNKSIMEALAKEFGSTMEFDVIIGNPPYQETTGGGKGGGGNTMYDKFILLGLELSQKYVSFVVPARWYTDETRTAYLRKKLLDNDRIIELHDFPDTDDLFKGVWIMGGVCYFLWDAKYSGECKFVEHRKGSTVESKRCLRNSHSDILIRNIDALTIVDKVLSKNEIPITEYMYNYNTFKLRSYERGDLIRTSDDQIEMYYTGNGIRGGAIAYIDRSYVCASTDLIDKHKIYINSVSDNMLAFPYKVLYPAFYGAPGTVCTESYMVIGPIKGEQYSKAVIDYLATKFVKALVLQCKTSQTTYKRVYKFVPSQDFTENSDIDWSKSVENINRQLYKKYNLSDSEIDYIERMIQ